MKKILKINGIIIFILVMIFTLSGCKNSQKEEKNLKEKLNAEISYIDNGLVNIINKLNDIDYVRYKVVEQEGKSIAKGNESNETETGKQTSEDRNTEENASGSSSSKEKDKKEGNSEGTSKSQENSKSSSKIFSMQDNSTLGKQTVDINWNELKSKIENLYTTWITVSNDLKKAGIPEEMLDGFDEKIDLLASSIKNSNKEETLNNAIALYEYLPKFVDIYTDDKRPKNVLDTKYNLLLCYKNADSEKWDEFQNSLSDLKKSFSNISDKKDEYAGKAVNISNASVIIKEMNNTVNIKEKDIFFIKYKNLIQELNIIASL